MLTVENETTFFTAENIDRLPYPVYLLNNDRLIIYKNKAAKMRAIGYRAHARLDKYTSPKLIEQVKSLEVGKELFVDLAQTEHTVPDVSFCYGAILRRHENGYCLVIRNITAQMLRYISERMPDVPFFFQNVGRMEENLRNAESASPSQLVVNRKRHNRTMRLYSEVTRFIQLVTGKYEKSETCEITSPFNILLEKGSKTLRPNGFGMVYKTYDECTFVKANCGMACYALTTMISIAAENALNGRFDVRTLLFEGDYLAQFTFEPDVDSDLYRGMVSQYYAGDLLASTHADMFFDLLLVQMAAEINGWRFSVSQDGCSGRFIKMTLYLPIAEEKPDVLNSPIDPLPLLELMLSRVLWRTEEDN